jgi:outer membrane protein OmpA-like peptidoglycan-associated protein
MQKTASLTGVTRQLEELNGRIKTANDALAELQKASAAIQRTSLEQIAQRLDKLDESLKGNIDAVANLQKSVPLANLGKQMGQMQANLTALDVALAEIRKSAPAMDAGKRFDALEAAVQGLSGRIGEIKTALDSGPAKTADPASAGALDAIKKSVESSAATGEKLLASVSGLTDDLQQQQKLQHELQQQLQKQPQGQAGMDLVVIHAEPAGAGVSAQAGKANGPETPMAPLGFDFKRLGAADDKVQSGAIVAKVQELLKGRSKCAISVAGYADTVGSDEFNLDLSKRRAHNVAERLRAALGESVQIAETGWGDRRLQVWTPDNTPKPENRRVDIAVRCDG